MPNQSLWNGFLKKKKYSIYIHIYILHIKNKTNSAHEFQESEHISECLAIQQCETDTDMKQKWGVTPWRLDLGVQDMVTAAIATPAVSIGFPASTGPGDTVFHSDITPPATEEQ